MIRFAPSPTAPLRLRRLILPLALVLVIAALAYQAWGGARGLDAWRQLAAARDMQENALATQRAQNDALYENIRRLRPEHLDLDFLDERARRVLGLAQSDETVIFDSETPPN